MAWAVVARAVRRNAIPEAVKLDDPRLDALYKATLRDIADYAAARARGEALSPPGGVGTKKVTP